jgi:DNA mismatch endonuclease (patch repair protein)
MMSGIRSKNTKAEVFIRKRLHARGFRYKLHGCFWHGHGCHLFKQPKSRTRFWLEKIDSNKRRDASAYQLLRESGWRIAEIWECALKGKTRLRSDAVIQSLAEWIKSDSELLSVTGE